jgi:hypothetical protein
MGNAQLFNRDSTSKAKKNERLNRDEERGNKNNNNKQEEEEKGFLAKYDPQIRLFMQIFNMAVAAAALGVGSAVLSNVYSSPYSVEHIYTPTDCIVLALGNYIVNDTDGTKTIANGWIGNTCGYGVDADLLVRYNNATSGEVNVTMASFTNVTSPQELMYFSFDTNVAITVQLLGQSQTVIDKKLSRSALQCLSSTDLGLQGTYLRNNCYGPVRLSYYCNDEAYFQLQNVVVDNAWMLNPFNRTCNNKVFTALQL